MVGKPVWATRTGSDLAGRFAAYSETTQDDLPYLVPDLMGSIAHVLGLHKANLVAAADARSLVAGLQDIHQAIHDGSFSLDPAREDGHMNIEAHLTRLLGDVGRRLHTGRSRNDQVATCIVLAAREGLLQVATATHDVAQALARQAAVHHETPWVARTHGQPAQPATLGFLLMAHALRCQDSAAAALDAFDAICESPLGAGAVAGSTLPLRPEYTAALLGLRPLRNALLATGTRDAALTALHAVSRVGLAAASVAADLLDLYAAGCARLADGHTTGSSLMPHKRNPDALELVRGHAKALTQAPAAATAIVAGMGLGYQRDFQRIKPLLSAGLTDGHATMAMLHEVVQGATFDAAALARTFDAPGITATDAAEALVAAGMPFRSAYEALAAASKANERGIALDDALAAQGLPHNALAAATAALLPDASRRKTLGGPAPASVQAMLTAFEAQAAALALRLAEAGDQVAVPRRLLSTPPEELLP